MKIPNSLKNCTNTLHDLARPIKNYVHAMKERRSTPRGQDAPERLDKLVSSPNTRNRRHNLRQALGRIFQSELRQATDGRSPFLDDDRYWPIREVIARAEARMRQRTNSADRPSFGEEPTTSGFFDDLPVEILRKIFEHCLPSQGSVFPTPTIYKAPLLLCRVCVHWEQVAMSMPILWSSFSADPEERRGDTSIYIPMMNLYLDFSRPHPLSFRIKAEHFRYENKLVYESFPLFLSEIHRWHAVTLKLDKTLCGQFLAGPLGCDSSLEALNLSAYCSYEQAQQLPAALCQFPRLRRLIIGHMPNAPLLELPWSQLTNIYLNPHLSPTDCINILNKSPGLVKCAFYNVTRPDTSINLYNITLPALTSLELGSVGGVDEILSCLTCPALTYLSIHAHLSVTECINFLKKSPGMVNCSLYHITPPHDAVRPHNITLPALTTLDVASEWVATEILAHLTCPALAHLFIHHNTWNSTLGSRVFTEFTVRSSCRLESLGLRHEHTAEDDVVHYISLPALQSLKFLELRGFGIGMTTLMMFLHVEGVVPVFMPLLESLVLDVEGVPDRQVSDVIASRFNSVMNTETGPGTSPVSLTDVDVRFRRRNRETSRVEADALRLEHVCDQERFDRFVSRGLHASMNFGQ